MNSLQLMPAHVLEVKRFICKQTAGIDKRKIKDYEIDFCMSGSRNIKGEGQNIPISAGSLIFRKPGQYFVSEGDYDVYMLTLSFSPELRIHPQDYRRDRNSEPQPLIAHPLINDVPTHIRTYRKQDYVRIFEQLCLCSYPMPENFDEQQILINELFLLVNADIFRNRLLMYDRQNPIVQKCCKYINENFEKSITLSSLAEIANLAPNYFLRFFKKEVGITPKEYILRIRLEHACSLLIETNLKIAAIAEKCGFNDTAYFSLFFKKRFGKSPNEYRKNLNQ